MARKLKPDKLLFLATLVLLGANVVMVYSASAVLAQDLYEQPYFYLFRQGTWVILGWCLLWAGMRFDYRRLKRREVTWLVLGVTAAALVAVLFSQPINASRRWFNVAGFGVAALGARQDRAHNLRRDAARAPDGPPQRQPLRAAADCRGDGRDRGPDPAAARSGDGLHPHRDSGGDGIRGRNRLSVRFRRGAADVAPSCTSSSRAPSTAAGGCSPSSTHGPIPGRRIPVDSVAHRGRHRRRVRTGTDARRAEALLPARAPYRLHLRGDCRGDRARGRHGHPAVLRRDHLERASCGQSCSGIGSARSSRSA